MNIEAIFIDAGGVILDESNYEESCAEHLTNAINSCGIEYTKTNYWVDYKEGILAFCPQSRQYVVWKVSNYNLDLYNQIWQKFLKTWTRPPLVLMPDIKKVLLNIANKYPLVLAGQYGAEVYELLHKNNIDCFSNSLSQDDFDITKPDPRYLKHIADASHVNSHSVVMIGDRIDNDVIPAIQLGMKTIFLKSSVYKIQQPRTPAECPSETIENVIEIHNAIKNIENFF